MATVSVETAGDYDLTVKMSGYHATRIRRLRAGSTCRVDLIVVLKDAVPPHSIE